MVFRTSIKTHVNSSACSKGKLQVESFKARPVGHNLARDSHIAAYSTCQCNYSHDLVKKYTRAMAVRRKKTTPCTFFSA